MARPVRDAGVRKNEPGLRTMRGAIPLIQTAPSAGCGPLGTVARGGGSAVAAIRENRDRNENGEPPCEQGFRGSGPRATAWTDLGHEICRRTLCTRGVTRTE